jgi:cellulose synthase/poly-beta-1,6-N-acetylglucosamine synthase-like glycosyltransferase
MHELAQWLALASVVLLAHTYVGYPLLVALLGRLFPLRTNVDPQWLPTVSAVIPVYNAARYIGRKLDSLLALDYPADRFEILVYCDGSLDRSAAIVREYAARDPRVRLIEGTKRLGKPHALNVMREAARGEVFLMTDIRQPLARGALRALVARLSDPRVGCVSGNLVLKGKSAAGLYWRYENWIRNSEAQFRSMVGATGPIYVVRRADLAPLPVDVILDDQWIPMRLRLQGRRLLLCLEAQAFDSAFDDRREFGRKVRTLAGNYQLFTRLPVLLVPFVNPSWFETVSHKLLRLAAPWVLAVLFVSSAVCAFSPAWAVGGPAWSLALRALFAAQLVFYLAALAGATLGRLGALARGFVVLSAAAVVGLWRYARGAQKVTW